jgi:hypothetical protein
MPTLPAELLPLIVEFAPLFSKPVWERAKTLLVGAILAVGKRTVTGCLRVTGNSQDKHFQSRAMVRDPSLSGVAANAGRYLCSKRRTDHRH